jgi:hypothetical protein
MGGGSKGKSAAEDRLHEMIRRWPAGDEVAKLSSYVVVTESDERDRECGLVIGELLNRELDFTILSVLTVPSEAASWLFSPDGPIGNFSDKIKLAEKLGAIDGVTVKNLNRIRIVRNAFAHSMERITFQTPEVADVCMLLQELPGWPVALEGMNDTPKRRFGLAAFGVYSALSTATEGRIDRNKLIAAYAKVGMAFADKMTVPASPEKSSPPHSPESES